jgi:hypothetical protein
MRQSISAFSAANVRTKGAPQECPRATRSGEFPSQISIRVIADTPLGMTVYYVVMSGIAALFAAFDNPFRA